MRRERWACSWPVHGEFRLNERGVWPIEVAARPIGGLCARALRFQLENESEPIGLEELLLRHALGLRGWMRCEKRQLPAY